MKKFFFPLDTVLDYKGRILENLKGEHARILLKVRECEEEIEALQEKWYVCSKELEVHRRRGMAINEMRTYENYMEALRLKIKKKQEEYIKLREEEEKKKEEVVEAKKETSSIEKLRERKLDEYNKQVQKEEEQFIEEFVSTRDAIAKLNE